jgi:hypothetical protein
LNFHSLHVCQLPRIMAGSLWFVSKTQYSDCCLTLAFPCRWELVKSVGMLW